MLKLKAVFVCLLWALCYPFISIALSESPPLYLAFMRSILAGGTLLLFGMGSPGSVIPRAWSNWQSIGIVGFGYTSLGFSGMFLAGSLVSPGLATVVSNSQPMIAVALAYVLAVERVTKRQLAALTIGLGGIIAIVLPSLHHVQNNLSVGGIGFVLLGALGVALGNVWMKKIAVEANVLRVSAWQLIVGSIPLGIAALVLEDPSTIVFGSEILVSLLVLAIPGTALATFMWFHVLKVGKLHRMNAFTFLTPLFALLIGAVFMGEVLQTNELIGTAIIIGGILVLHWPSSRIQTA